MASLKLLIVEDEVLTARLMEVKLSKAGFDVVDPVSSGEDAIESVKANKPDVVLMDINLMGEIDGIEAARKIQKNNDTKIIFITGYTSDTIKKRAMAINPYNYLVKPLEMEHLKELLLNISK